MYRTGILHEMHLNALQKIAGTAGQRLWLAWIGAMFGLLAGFDSAGEQMKSLS
jgi:hypothetical protein